jgi:hypothetical protein
MALSADYIVYPNKETNLLKVWEVNFFTLKIQNDLLKLMDWFSFGF